MQFFPTTSPVGSTVTAALRMWQGASVEERKEYQAFSTCAGAHKPLSQMGIDSLCEALRYYGGALMTEAGNPLEHHSVRPIDGPDMAGAITPGNPWHFAGARDGSLCYGVCEATEEEAAREEALRACAEEHGLECRPDDYETELDGFAVWQAHPPALPEQTLAKAFAAGVASCHPSGVSTEEAAAKSFARWIEGAGAALRQPSPAISPREEALDKAVTRALASGWLSIDHDRNRTPEACDIRGAMCAAVDMPGGER